MREAPQYGVTVAPTPAPAETAYYYPEPFWHSMDGGWIKSLLLFFDEIAILLPHFMRRELFLRDPSLAGPLEERGLLRILEPEWFIDDVAARKLTDTITSLMESGAFDHLADAGFGDLSKSRMGFPAAPEEAQRLIQALSQRGLVASISGVPMLHGTVRATYLTVLAQLARETGARHYLDLHPVTNDKETMESLSGFLEYDAMPSRGQVVSFDLEVVTVHLDAVPLREVLQFKDENREEHRRYMQHLRTFALELSMFDSIDRQRTLANRRAELKEEAHQLLRRSWQAWRSPRSITGFALGLTGAAWALKSGDPVPAVLGALGAGLGMIPAEAAGNAYSYLFRASRDLRY
jgi:hypothetical protein